MKCLEAIFCNYNEIVMLIYNVIFHSVSSGGKLRYSEVKAFLQKKDSMSAVYKLIKTSVNSSIHLSENHLIYARKGRNNKFIPM